MSARVTPKAQIVRNSTPRRDGGYLVVTTKGQSGHSHEPIPEGTHVLIQEGKAERLNP